MLTPAERGPHSPVIAVYNQAKTPLGADLALMVTAWQEYLDSYFMPVWNRSATLQLTDGPTPKSWSLVLLDTADVEGALAYHDEVNHLPICKVFVKTTLEAGENLSVSATHELVEALGDPACNRYATLADGTTMYAFELADPVEESSFEVMGFQMSNFVRPEYFEFDPLGKSTDFDQMKVLKAPFSLAEGGYAIVCRAGHFENVFGSAAKAERFAKEDRRGHRSEYRKK